MSATVALTVDVNYLSKLSQLIARESVEEWRMYLSWCMVVHLSKLSSKKLRRLLTKVLVKAEGWQDNTELVPPKISWYTCLQHVHDLMPTELAYLYQQNVLPPTVVPEARKVTL